VEEDRVRGFLRITIWERVEEDRVREITGEIVEKEINIVGVKEKRKLILLE
jgi:hypothetical protein